ncbi:cytochrome c biogenesis protein CcsA [Cellulophaga baltica]|uniref:cytochrome c biogenesis protein n=1 Tax=Cellulophaga TaxID=104264 RepID=UPI001C07B4AF|nr:MULTISPECIES: cytochrome c biogenesis protein CcsA [Cellulophaga]MBU2997305.1 cytochrome c biogenesis protein CcsA [Cellulophaga baltica]MDO6768703.1 cytochrome c biogenesis protein CcsA [Cellulophaga sp. 1_MG-2023]
MKALLKKFFFSTRLMSVLFIVFAIAMGLGTFIESWYSTDTARIYIYNTTWFEAIMVFFVINFIGNMFRYKLLRIEKWATLILHLSWILIILGAFITRYISFEGMMPIREGESSNIFYSDKAFLNVNVEGEINGEKLRKPLEEDIIVTTEGIKSSLPWKMDFDGQPFTVSFVKFIEGAKEDLVADDNGNEYLKIVEAGDGERHDHYIESGEVTSIHNVLFSLNKPTDGAINILFENGEYHINSPFDGDFMRMADQFRGDLVKDSLQTLQLRSLYNTAGMQFVIPDPVIKGSYGIVQIPEEEVTENDRDAIVLDITSNGETVQKTVLGGKGSANFTDNFNVGGLDFSIRFGSKEYELPFSIKLNDFIAEKYPGTEKGFSSFMSKVTIEDERPFDYDIYMNHVLDHQGYRFFQANFDPDEKGTGLSVNHDFWGTWITYIGYFLLYIGLMGIMFFGKTRFKDLTASLDKLNEKKRKLLTVFALFLTLGFSVNAQEIHSDDDGHDHNSGPTEFQIDSILKSTTVSKEHAENFGKLVIQDDGGRMKPINTYSSELLRKLSFKAKYKDLNSDQVFLSMMLSPALWYNTEFIALDKKGQNDSIRKIIGIPSDQRYVKATDFFDEKGISKFDPFLENAFSTTNPNKFQTDIKDTYLRLGLLNRALGGEIIKVFPLLDDENNKWISPVEYRSGNYPVKDSLYGNFMKNALPFYLLTVKKAIKSGDYSEADKLLKAFKQNQRNNGAEVLPTETKINTEVFYNKADIFNKLYKYYALVGLIMFFLLIFQIFKDRKGLRIGIKSFKVIIWVLFVLHTAGLILRWYISGHAPWSDAYESILYVSWATMGIGLAFSTRSNLTIASTAFVASMLLWIAHGNWVDPAVANLQPVLDSYWLMIHVAVIVGSYGPLTVGMILGVVSLILILLTNEKNKKRMELNLKEITIVNELALTAGLVMLTIGNFLGGQWANESWGRYWGWDPKETWALVSIMVYAFVIHMRLVPGMRSRWLFNFMSVVAFASIMMTYFGVNFYLAGLHSYASGAQVITPTFVYYTVAGVFILGGFSFWKYKKYYSKK